MMAGIKKNILGIKDLQFQKDYMKNYVHKKISYNIKLLYR